MPTESLYPCRTGKALSRAMLRSGKYGPRAGCGCFQMCCGFGQSGKSARHAQEKLSSGIGQFDPVGPSQEDLLAAAVFQQADMLADGRRGYAQLLGDCGEAARAGRPVKGLKSVQGQAVAHRICAGVRSRFGLRVPPRPSEDWHRFSLALPGFLTLSEYVSRWMICPRSSTGEAR